MMNKKIIMIIGMVLLVAGLAYASGVVLFGGNSHQDIDDGLVLDIDLTQDNYVSGTKTFADDSGEGNDGVSTNAATFTTDKYGMSTGAMSFNGGTDVVTRNTLVLGSSATFEGWGYANTLTTKMLWNHPSDASVTYFDVFFYSNLISMNTGNGASNPFKYPNGTNIPLSAISLNTWHHYVTVLDSVSNQALLYVDGIYFGNASYRNPTSTSARTFSIGGASSSYRWSGSISNFKIYNRSLSSTEVQTLYNSSKPKISSSPLQKGLIGHWALDSEDYNSNIERVADKTPYSNHGTNYGATLTTDQMGQSNRAMYFDGGSDHINLGNNVLFNSSKPVTISFWAKLNGYSVSYPVPLILKTEQATGFIFFYSNSGSYSGFNFGSSANFVRLKAASGLGSSLAGKWKHFIMIYDGVSRTTESSYKLYIDGVEQSLITASAFAVVPLVNNISSVTTGQQFNGSITDVRIYDRALSADEIDTLYNSYRPKAASGSLQKGLVLDMPLTSEYITGDTPGSELIRDRTPYSNDGQNYGATIGSGYSSFDGSNDYIDLSDLSETEGISTLSVSAWVKTTDSIAGFIVAKSSGGTTSSYALYNTAAGKVNFFVTNSTPARIICSKSYSINDNLWHHLVGIYNGTKIVIYADGSNIGDCNQIGNINNVVTFTKIGAYNSYTDTPWNGSISSVKIYNRALSDSEIKLLYDKGR